MLTNQTFIGRALRLPLRLIPRDATVKVLSGITRGAKWRVGSSVHGCWIGTYERPKQRVVRRITKPDMIAWDIGANVGFYTLGFCALGARVWAFEPDPANLRRLHHHIRINGVNAQIVEAAVSDSDGTAGFAGSGSTARIVSQSDHRVRTITLDSLDLPRPDIVKIDIEGGELAALRGASRLIARRRTVWLVALDDPATNAECRAIFLSAGYAISDLGSRNEIIAEPRQRRTRPPNSP